MAPMFPLVTSSCGTRSCWTMPGRNPILASASNWEITSPYGASKSSTRRRMVWKATNSCRHASNATSSAGPGESGASSGAWGLLDSDERRRHLAASRLRSSRAIV